MSSSVEKLKAQVQELQRDLTMRRCLTKTTTVEELQACITEMERKLLQHKSTVEQKQPVLEKVGIITRLETCQNFSQP